MKFKEIAIGMSRKISDGNYGSSEYHVGTTVSLENGDTPSKVIAEVSRFLRLKLGEVILAGGK